MASRIHVTGSGVATAVPVNNENRGACDAGPVYKNHAPSFAAKIMKSESALGDPALQQDYQLLKNGHAMYLNEFFCKKRDYDILKNLASDLEANAGGKGMINWSQHFKHENPEFSQTFQQVLRKMSDYFDLDVYATRLNFYPNNSSWKPFHHDSHAYGGRKLREDLTVGASFGATRALVFKHASSGHQFGFPQNNGDVFAFTTKVNTQFMHGVPREKDFKSGPRFSIIAWGRRRTINSRNAGREEIGTRDFPEEGSCTVPELSKFTTNDDAPIEASTDSQNEVGPSVADISDMVDRFVLQETTNAQKIEASRARSKNAAGSKRKQGRIQGGWGGGQGGRARGNNRDGRTGGGRTGGGGRTCGGGRAGRGRANERDERLASTRSNTCKVASSRRAPPPEPEYSDDDY